MGTRLLLAAALVFILICFAFAAPVSADPSNTSGFSDLLVRFQPGLTDAEINQALAFRGLAQVDYDADLDMRRVRAKGRANLRAAMRELRADARVLVVEPNYQVEAAVIRRYQSRVLLSSSALSPNDPLFGLQWGLQRVQAPLAWAFARGSTVTIAAIDSGIDLKHPDLRARIVRGFNFLSPGAPPQDDFGHGTHIAGIAAAIQNNHIGIAGTAVNVNIMPLKILDQNGEGTVEDLAKAIFYAARHSVRVVNMSLGTLTEDNRCPQILQEQVNVAHARGVLLAAAAGNQGGTDPFFPAACGNVVAVTSSDFSDILSGFDNIGNWIDITAPGEDIISTMPGGDYEFESGTSMATAFVAGAAAMVWSRNPGLQPDDIERILERSADRFGWTGHVNTYGWGRLNAAYALRGTH
jgi:thermitase